MHTTDGSARENMKRMGYATTKGLMNYTMQCGRNCFPWIVYFNLLSMQNNLFYIAPFI